MQSTLSPNALTFATIGIILTGAAAAGLDRHTTTTEDHSSTVSSMNAFSSHQLFTLIVTIILTLGLAKLIKSLLSYQWILSEGKLGMPVMHSPRQGRPLPVLGHALQFLKHRPWDLLMEWHETYGPIVCFRLLGHTNFSIASPALLKVVLQSKIASVKKDIAFTMKPFLVILGTGIVTSEDDSWMKQRLKMSHPLRRDVLEMIPRQTLQAVQLLMQSMDQACETNEPVAIGASLRRLTLQVISGSFLSLSAEESDSTFAQYYLPIVDEANVRVWMPHRTYLPILPAWWKQHYNVYRLNTYVSKLVRGRWSQRRRLQRSSESTLEPQDILDRMLMVYEKEQGTDAVNLPESHVRQLRDEMKTFMLAGHETSAAMMTWAIYELLYNDALTEQLREECDKVFSANKDWKTAQSTDIPDAERLAELVLSEATLRESLRKYSVVPLVARRTIADMHIQDEGHNYLLPKGSSLLLNIQAVHHDPSLWPEPMKFDPQRFLGKEPEPYTFLPFIAGPRNCLGQYLALLESKMVISLLLQRYRFQRPDGGSLDAWSSNNDPRHRYMVPVIPAKELMVRVSRK
ncbi:hypothetical protein MPSEU_000698700 [Mayamaea pseudoterrestris]|nr:hypothetical protein MPSEU_000698700 [Mayamaea pseudoterrestris]